MKSKWIARAPPVATPAGRPTDRRDRHLALPPRASHRPARHSLALPLRRRPSLLSFVKNCPSLRETFRLDVESERGKSVTSHDLTRREKFGARPGRGCLGVRDGTCTMGAAPHSPSLP